MTHTLCSFQSDSVTSPSLYNSLSLATESLITKNAASIDHGLWTMDQSTNQPINRSTTMQPALTFGNYQVHFIDELPQMEWQEVWKQYPSIFILVDANTPYCG